MDTLMNVTLPPPLFLPPFPSMEYYPPKISLLKAWEIPIIIAAIYISLVITLLGAFVFTCWRRRMIAPPHAPLATHEEEEEEEGDIEMQEMGTEVVIPMSVYEGEERASSPYQQDMCCVCLGAYEVGEEICYVSVQTRFPFLMYFPVDGP